ncbi:MAG: glycosyltransferase [Synergistaceae bacterium]|jgi:glycosyltransferase involved in cell wall biosynthesis|nr:glycosyltransferase [Synergistaceae bacterium]
MQKKVKHIALCIPDLRGGGAERSNVQIANGLAHRGHSVDLVVFRKEGPYFNDLAPEVRVVEMEVSRARYAILPLRRYLMRERPDVAISSLINVPLVIASRFFGRRTKIVLSERAHFSSMRDSARTLSERASASLARFLYPMADKITAVSRSCADDLVKLGIVSPGDVAVFYNPVVSNKLDKLKLETPEQRWPRDGGMRVILAVGRLAPEKDYDALLAAFADVDERSACLLILGEGSERGRLESMIQKLGLTDRVSMPGFVNNPYSYMARADVFVLCSKFEGLPGALIQAMACGLTPVVTDSPGGSAEILGDGLRDYLVPVGDVSALSDAISKALRNPLPPDVLKERASIFSDEASIDAYEKLIYELCE